MKSQFKLAILIALLVGIGKIVAQSDHSLSSIQFQQKFEKNATQYGIVLPGKVGVITSAHSEGSKLTISFESDGKSTTLSGISNENRWQSDEYKNLKFTFNSDGTAKSGASNSKDGFILIGEKSTDNKVIADLSKKGLRGISMDLVIKNKLPGHDAPNWFYYSSDDYIQISFVFPENFVHPSYGPQARVRIFKYEKIQNKWKVREDNSSVQ